MVLNIHYSLVDSHGVFGISWVKTYRGLFLKGHQGFGNLGKDNADNFSIKHDVGYQNLKPHKSATEACSFLIPPVAQHCIEDLRFYTKLPILGTYYAFGYFHLKRSNNASPITTFLEAKL